MKLYVESPPNMSRAMHRVVAAMKRVYHPEIEFVENEALADLVFLHVIGYPETEQAVHRLIANGQHYAIIQYCIRTTQEPSTHQWMWIWNQALLVWSYYDLIDLMMADEVEQSFMDQFIEKFYFSPLGIDEAFRTTTPIEGKAFTMMTSGYLAESESVREVSTAVAEIGGRQFHLGPRTAAPGAYATALGIDDRVLADVYSRCCWVAGLRRGEGFEMPAAEGLACGARPIMFDAPHYRQWFDPWADFIPEGGFDETVDALVDVFESGCRLVTDEERASAIALFDWDRIITGLWNKVVAHA